MSNDLKTSATATCWHFGLAELDEGTFELRLDGQLLEVERKPIEVLLCLLRHGNEMVSKEKILEAVWPGRIVTESVLTKCIAKLREALKDHRQSLIKTQHGQGYRLAVPVRAERSVAHEIQFAPALQAAPAMTAAMAPLAIAPSKLPETPAAVSSPWFRNWRTAFWLVAAVGAILAFVLWFAGNERPAPSAVTKSVAVLPFANLSGDADNGYFTEGLHDSVLTNLALIQDLSVISRTSVMQYGEGARNLRQIARALGVDNIVEGSVQRSGNRMRVTAQLIDTRTDTHVWAGQFDRDLSDVFAVQAELAQQIAGAIHARLTPEEKGRIERKPTQNTAAYELYLRGLEVTRRANWDYTEIEAAIAQVEQAVALDPKFGLAYALLSGLHDSLYWSGPDKSPDRRTLVREAAEKALQLDPGLPESHIAMGRYLYHGSRDYVAAIKVLQKAQQLAPGNADVPFWLAAIYRRQGRWDEAVTSFERSLQLDPRNEQVLAEYGFTVQALKRYAEADALYARLEVLAPKPELVRLKRAYLQMNWNGNLEPLERALAAVADIPNSGCELPFARWQLRYFQRQFDAAATAALACTDDYTKSGHAGAIPRQFFAAVAYEAARNPAAARPLYQEARTLFEKNLAGHTDQAEARLAYAHALRGLGDREAALAQAQMALAEMPLSVDALTGTAVITLAAGFYAIAGDTTRALDLLERSLSLPSGEYVHSLELNPVYDPLRKEPRYRELIARHLKRPSP